MRGLTSPNLVYVTSRTVGKSQKKDMINGNGMSALRELFEEYAKLAAIKSICPVSPKLMGRNFSVATQAYLVVRSRRPDCLVRPSYAADDVRSDELLANTGAAAIYGQFGQTNLDVYVFLESYALH